MDSILNQTVVPPPPGQFVNLIDPPSQSYLIYITCAICLAISTIVVWIRIYVNVAVLRHFSWDDTLIILCWLLVIPMVVFLCRLPHYGALMDIWNVKFGNLMKLLQWMFWLEILYSLELLGIKTVVLVLYKRVFVPQGTRNWVYYCIVGTGVFNALFYVADIFVRIFSCTPVSAAWNLLETGHCIDVWTMIIGTACLNTVDNVLILLVPISIIWKLQMPKKRKMEVILVFTFSILSIVASVMRVIYSVRASKALNQTVVVAEVSLWATAELACYYLCACVPAMPRFVKHIGRKLRRENTSLEEGPSQESSPRLRPKPPVQRLKSIPIFSAFALSFSSPTTSHASSRTERDPYFVPDFASQKFTPQSSMTERDPYFIPQFTSRTTDRDFTPPQSSYAENEILVNRTVEIRSVPKFM